MLPEYMNFFHHRRIYSLWRYRVVTHSTLMTLAQHLCLSWLLVSGTIVEHTVHAQVDKLNVLKLAGTSLEQPACMNEG